jgi:hypothetical protein
MPGATKRYTPDGMQQVKMLRLLKMPIQSNQPAGSKSGAWNIFFVKGPVARRLA